MESQIFPKTGRSYDHVKEQVQSLHQADTRWNEGRVFSLVYSISEEHDRFLKDLYTLYFHENALNPGAFPTIQKFEAEVIHMACELLNGKTDSVNAAGTMTSGGSESIMMAVKSARDFGFQKKGIREPELILCSTAHPAFDKAAHYFGVKVIKVDPRPDLSIDVSTFRERINANTIMMVGSAPQYPHGVMDPISELSALAIEKNVWLHVDACVGGFMLPFLRLLNESIPDFDFKLSGVSSISADIHKYGFAAKGASVILYRSEELRRFQFFVSKDWSGGLFASPSMTGTRPAGSIVAAWGTLQALGMDGYLKIYRELIELRKGFESGLSKVGARVLGKPVGTLLAYDVPGVNVFVIADLMEKKGWFVDRQQNPASIHLTLTPMHTKAKEKYLIDLENAIQAARANPSLENEGMAAMYGMVAKIPDPTQVMGYLYQYMDARYQLPPKP